MEAVGYYCHLLGISISEDTDAKKLANLSSQRIRLLIIEGNLKGRHKSSINAQILMTVNSIDTH